MKPTLSFDALALHAVVDEIRARFLDGRIQRVSLIDEWTVALELYARGERAALVISTDPHAARVYLTRQRPERASEAVTPLLLLLRKYVRDGRLERLDQPPLERLLELRVSSRDEAGEHRDVGLIIEVMGRRSNVILVGEDGTILDALRRASPEKNPTRPILPRRRYEPPPSQNRLNPFAADSWEHVRARSFEHPEALLADLLGRELAGISPLLARELAFRGTGDVGARAGATDWPAVRAAATEMLAPARGHGPWSPSIAREDGRIVAYAAYRLHHLEAGCDVEDVSTMSDAIELAYGDGEASAEGRERGDAVGGITRPLLEAITTRRALVQRRHAALLRSRDAAGNPDELREAGQYILASIHQIAPGQDSLDIPGRTIRLDPLLTPADNAQQYFKEYRRARDASRRVPELLARADHELAHLDDMETLVRNADDPGRVRTLRSELRESGVLRDRAPRPVKGRRGQHPDDGPRPITVPLGDGFVALVGTSARGNERVTFDLGTQDDVWLHARQMPGSHVLVRTGGRAVPRPLLERAAQIAAYYSRGRTDRRVPVDWTPRKFVRRIRGGPPGLVSYINEQTIDATPRPPEQQPGVPAGSRPGRP
ncbi:MAG: NFACT family protein [Chloroflexi bacterium]|nr:NFACT family protein [Chloroflexota bacterium]